jgi:hypothetical protein
MPLHNNTISPVRATETSNLVRVRKTRTAFHGGSLALAAFQFMPPFGRIILQATYVQGIIRSSAKALLEQMYHDEIASAAQKRKSNEWNGLERPKGVGPQSRPDCGGFGGGYV